MSMDTIMEEYEYSFDSNTDAIVYGVSDPSRSDESMISAPNIPSSSSKDDDDVIHQQQQQQQISVAAAASGDGTDDLTVSSCASSSWFTNDNNNNNNKQIEQKAVMIFNVDFGELSRLAVRRSCDNEPIEDPLMSPGFSFSEWQEEVDEVIHINWSSVREWQVEDDLLDFLMSHIPSINWSAPANIGGAEVTE